jgi:uncharacterized phage protein gp47/JayE
VSLSTPTTETLSANIIGQLEGELSQTIPLLPKAFCRVLAKVLAAVFVLLFRYAGFIFLQLFVAHASMSETTVNGKKLRPLVELGRLFGVGDPQDATRAEHTVQITVKSLSGTLSAGDKLLRAETGVIYDVVAAINLDAATKLVHIRASGDGQGNGGVGTIGNLTNGDIVSFAKPLSNVATDAVVTATVVAAADAETPDNYRRRIFQRVQRRPQGGAYADYQSWAEEVEGIVAAYPYAGAPGEVDVYVEATEASSGSPDGIPTAPQLAAVLASIEINEAGLATRRPVNAAINVLPISRVAFAVTISSLDPDTTENRAAIKEGADEYLRSRRPYIVGLSSLPREDRITEAAVSGIVDSIVNAQGATVTTVGLTPGPAYTLGPGQLAKLDGDPDFV